MEFPVLCQLMFDEVVCRFVHREVVCEDLLAAHQHHADTKQHGQCMSLDVREHFGCTDCVDECQHGVGVLRGGPHTQYRRGRPWDVALGWFLQHGG